MFCNQCGAAIQAGSIQCSRCGTAIVRAARPTGYPIPAAYGPSKLERRLPIVAVLWVVYGVLELLRAAAVHLFLHLSRFWLAGPDWSHWVGPWVLGWVVAWSVFSAVLAFVAAWGLNERLLWGRTAGIVASIFAILHPPFGTILGIYTLVLLLSGEAADQYARVARI